MNEMQENQAATVETQANTNEEKTFTQEDVNRIVSERLERDRKKQEKDIAEREAALQEREKAFQEQTFKHEVSEYLKGKGLSEEWGTLWNMKTLDELQGNIDKAKELARMESKLAGVRPGGSPLRGAPSIDDAQLAKLKEIMGIKKG